MKTKTGQAAAQPALARAASGWFGKRQLDLDFAGLKPGTQRLLIDALYNAPQIMLYGMLTSAVSAALCYYLSGDGVYLLFALAILIGGLVRHNGLLKYQADPHLRSLADWREAAIANGAHATLALGLMTAYAINSGDHFNEMLALCNALGSLQGITSRNYSSRRLVILQVSFLIGPITAACLAQMSLPYFILAMMTVPLFLSVLRLAGHSRATLLQLAGRKSELKQVIDQFHTATEHMQHGLAIVDESGAIARSNQRLIELLDLPRASRWESVQLSELLDRVQQQRPQTARALRQLLVGDGDASTAGDRPYRKTVIDHGGGVHLELNVSCHSGHTVVLVEDVSDRIRSADRLTYLATHDPLTGLLNRSQFETLVKRALGTRAAGECLLMVLDLDGFKDVNDTHGHATGDQLLIQTARVIEKTVSDIGFSCRFGGDEFVIFLPHCQLPADPAARPVPVAWLQAALASEVQLSCTKLNVAASIGATAAVRAEANYDRLLRYADLALYESKRRGRAEYTLFTAELEEKYRDSQVIKEELRAAIAARELSVVFQPIVDADTETVRNFEALCRWHSCTRGQVSPAVFVPIAEEIGVVSALTDFVLEQAISCCARWPEPTAVSVNVSAKDFDRPAFVDTVQRLLGEYALRPERLILEITESTVAANAGLLERRFAQLRALGVQFALDDFGTGYSNFSYLQELSLHKLKIDRAFVQDIVHNKRSQALIRGLCGIAKALGMTVTVEGVENVEQLLTLQRIAAVHEIQGWLYSAPLSASQAQAVAGRPLSRAPTSAELLRFPSAG